MLGFNLLLWTAAPGVEHRALFESLKGMGYGLVELPVFHGDSERCRALAPLLEELGLARTALSARGADDNPLSPDPAMQKLAIENGCRSVDCALALGARKVVGPMHSGFGVHSGSGPTAGEWDRALRVMDIGYDGDIVVEAFGTGVAELIPLVKIWRKAYDTEEALARDAYAFVKGHAA